MKKLILATTLALGAAHVSAAPVDIIGQIAGTTVVGGLAATTQAYTPVNPGFSGSVDDVTGDYTFFMDDYQLQVDVWFGPVGAPGGGAITGLITVLDGTVSGNGTLDGHVVTTTQGAGSSCVDPASLVCTGTPAVPTLGVLSFDGTVGTLVTTLDDSVANGGNGQAGVITSTYNFGVAPVPVPAAAWLFGSALLGLVGVKRRKA